MIPKKIHYCWFGGGPKGKKELKCIESWKKFCPDYEIIEWNETNVDLDMMPFVREAYNAKKYAFVSDVVRLWILINNGGLYFDTDVEIIKSFDNLLKYNGFIGFENNNFLNTGQGVGAQKNNPIIKEMFDYYKNLKFINPDGSYNMYGCPKVNTEVLVNHGLQRNGQFQIIDNFAVFPMDYFNPYDDPTGMLNITENTHSIHWYSKSWMNKKSIIRSKLSKPFHRLQKLFRENYGK